MGVAGTKHVLYLLAAEAGYPPKAILVAPQRLIQKRTTRSQQVGSSELSN
jgi:hypothetical protein